MTVGVGPLSMSGAHLAMLELPNAQPVAGPKSGESDDAKDTVMVPFYGHCTWYFNRAVIKPPHEISQNSLEVKFDFFCQAVSLIGDRR